MFGCTFSVACSPVSKVAQRGNLTGLPRNVRDSIAEFYTQIETWETAHLEGALLITRMTALDLFSNPQQRNLNLDSAMQLLCDALEATFQQMVCLISIFPIKFIYLFPSCRGKFYFKFFLTTP
jgi:hypothetical protein